MSTATRLWGTVKRGHACVERHNHHACGPGWPRTVTWEPTVRALPSLSTSFVILPHCSTNWSRQAGRWSYVKKPANPQLIISSSNYLKKTVLWIFILEKGGGEPTFTLLCPRLHRLRARAQTQRSEPIDLDRNGTEVWNVRYRYLKYRIYLIHSATTRSTHTS